MVCSAKAMHQFTAVCNADAFRKSASRHHDVEDMTFCFIITRKHTLTSIATFLLVGGTLLAKSFGAKHLNPGSRF